MDMSIAAASLLALFLESLFYGVFLTLYLLTLLILLTKTGIHRRLLFPVAILLFCIATAHVVVGFVRSLQAFVFNVQANADAYYSNYASPLYLAQSVFYLAQTILADCVLVWRCYVLNNRSHFVAIPGCIALLANGVTGCYVVWSFSTGPTGHTIRTVAGGCIIAFYAMTMVISITCTGLIARCIYRAPFFIQDGTAPFLPVFIVVIETGALYTGSVIVILVLYLTGSKHGLAPLYNNTPIIGIAFCLAILQVHFQVGGNRPAEYPAEPRGIIADLSQGRGVREMYLIGHTSVMDITADTETKIETEMMQPKRQSFSSDVF